MRRLVPERVLTGLWPRTFRLALLDKDVGIAREYLAEMGVSGPLIDLAGRLFSQARAELGEEADYLEAIKLIEGQAGVALRASPHLPLLARVVQFPALCAEELNVTDWGATQRVQARVVLAEASFSPASSISWPAPLIRRTIESPLEMLNRDDPFFALTQPEGGVTFVSKAQVSVVACQDHQPLEDPDRATAAKLVSLTVELLDGVEYRGRSAFELPPSRARALDYVNASLAASLLSGAAT